MSEADRFMVGLRQPFSNENRLLGHRVPLYSSGNDPFGGLPMNLSQKNDSTVERGQRRRRIQWQELAGGWIRPHRGYASPGAVRQTGASKVGGNRKPKCLLCPHLRSNRLQRLKPDLKICRHEGEVNQKERLARHACARKNLFESRPKEVLTVITIIRRRRRGRH